MRGISDPFGRAEDVEADEENCVQYYHYFDNAYLHGSIIIVRGEVLNNILNIDQRSLRCRSIFSW